MDELLNQLKDAAQSVNDTLDEKARRRTIDTLREIQYALETPEETMQRLIHCHTTAASICVSFDLNVFDILAKSEKPLTLSELAKLTRADPFLLGRFLRHQASLGIVTETHQDTFTASITTRNLAMPNILGSFQFYRYMMAPAIYAIPDFLAHNKYQNPTDFFDTPFHKAFKTKESVYSWLGNRSDVSEYFDQFLQAWRSSLAVCFDVWDVAKESHDWPADKPVFVDVAGGAGQQCLKLIEKFPVLSGRVVLQDSLATINGATTYKEIESIPYDIFSEQPVKQAKYYYLRSVLHNYSDEKGVEILNNQAAAMSPDSTLVIDDVVCPNANVDWYTTQVDIAMLSLFSSLERTEAQWETLLAKAGLKIEKIACYTWNYRLSVIFAKKA